MGLTKWEGYNIAREDIFRFTHSDAAPWTAVRANDKRRTTLNAMRFVLTRIDYTGKDFSVASATRPIDCRLWPRILCNAIERSSKLVVPSLKARTGVHCRIRRTTSRPTAFISEP